MPKYTARPMPKPSRGSRSSASTLRAGIYLDRCAEPGVDLDAEQKIVFDALREIAGKRATQRGQAPKPTPRRCPGTAAARMARYDLTRAGAHLRHRP